MANGAESQELLRVWLKVLAARKHFDNEHPEHHGLALILLDAATEALIRLIVREQDMWFRAGELLKRQNEEFVAAGLEPPHSVQKFDFAEWPDFSEVPLPVYLSQRQKNELKDNFDPNVDVSVFFGFLSLDQGKALKHLHKYRNGAYHRNVLNVRTIRVLVEVQIVVVASLLRTYASQKVYSTPFLGEGRRALEALGLGRGTEATYDALSEILDKEITLDTQKVSEVLEGNLTQRLTQSVKRIQRTKDQMSLSGISLSDWTALIQSKQPWPTNHREIRALRPNVPLDKLQHWREELEKSNLDETALQAFARFVEIDGPLNKLEVALESVEDEIDYEVQRLIDIRRGK